MAKFANITYGTGGDTGIYTVVVNDNVRVRDYISTTPKHYISKEPFGTTGLVQSTVKETSVEGKRLRAELDNKKTKAGEDIEIGYAMTGKEAGAKHERTAAGTFAKGSGLEKAVKGKDGLYHSPSPSGSMNTNSQYVQQTRKANLKQTQEHGSLQKGESFDSYSSRFLQNRNKGD